MQGDETVITAPAGLSPAETEALNRHGVFFKKRVLQELQAVASIKIESEELGVSFGKTTAIDILARDQELRPHLVYVFECKRAYTKQKRWVFFRDFDTRYRVARYIAAFGGHVSVFSDEANPPIPVCSEGYELHSPENDSQHKPSKTNKGAGPSADQDPIFSAASQLSLGYLGFITRRDREIQKTVAGNAVFDQYERYVPVLVTTAEIFVVQADFTVELKTGNVNSPLMGEVFDAVILKHPFPSPLGVGDFRDIPAASDHPRYWNQVYKESVYVVGATALAKFMAERERIPRACP